MTLSEAERSLIESRRVRPPGDRDFLVFAYGSLMWRPGFQFRAVEPATLHGYHRAFCITSTHYRGSPQCPGLVLGLDRGGRCMGRLYRVESKDAAEVARYLHERELITGCYVPRWLSVTPAEGGREKALAYVADRSHYQYAGKLPQDEVVSKIRHAVGVMGSNAEYLRNTVQHLDELGVEDSSLHRLLDRLRAAD
jgi:cation transport protein ChaC